MNKHLVYGQDETIGSWVAERIGGQFDGKSKAIGIADSHGIIAGVLYNGYYEGVGINMHVAAAPGRKWAYPHFLNAFFTYPFIQLSLRRVTAPAAAKNSRVIKLLHHLGFRIEGVLRNGLKDDDLIIFGMLKEECRYIGR